MVDVVEFFRVSKIYLIINIFNFWFVCSKFMYFGIVEIISVLKSVLDVRFFGVMKCESLYLILFIKSLVFMCCGIKLCVKVRYFILCVKC